MGTAFRESGILQARRVLFIDLYLSPILEPKHPSSSHETLSFRFPRQVQFGTLIRMSFTHL